MTKVFHKNAMITRIDFCDEVGYDFNPYKGSVEVVDIGKDKIEKVNIINVLATVSTYFQKKNKEINHWQKTANYWENTYQTLKRRLYITAFVLSIISVIIAFCYWSLK